MNVWRSVSLLTALAAVLCGPAGAAAQKAPDWNALSDEAVGLLQKYVQVDTTNPPGNEIEAAKFLKAFFDKEGIENRIVESAPGRASIFARLRGDGSKKGVVLLNHTDVVPVDRRYWTANPFGGAIKDGYLWGRGTIDMKGMGVVEAMAMAALKRGGTPLKGDVIFLGVADEEAGGTMGAGHVVDKHLDLVKDAGVVINEGGSLASDESGKVLFYGIDTAEKSPLWIKLTAKGTPGHGSMPRTDSAANKLARVLERIVNYQTPIKVSADVQRYFADTSSSYPAAVASRLKDLRTALQDPAFAAEFTKTIRNNALVRNTISLTMMEASNKVNVISPEASAQLDMRLLPGEKPEAVLADLRKVIGDESVEIEVLQSFVAGSSPTDNDLFRVITEIARKRNPDVPITTLLLYAFTDCHFFREKGIPCYGFMPFKFNGSDIATVHGNDERISVQNIKDGTQMMTEIVTKLAAE